MCCSKACRRASIVTGSRAISRPNVAGVREVHHMHVWSLDGAKNMATLHACLTEGVGRPQGGYRDQGAARQQARHRACDR